MKGANLIKKAVLSEKTHKQMDSGLYTFLVDSKANKSEIASVIEKQFQVNVTNVNVLSKAPKSKRIFGSRRTAQISGGKKAIVTLQKGQNIALFSVKKEKSKSTKNEAKNDSKVVNTQDVKERKNFLSRFRKRKESYKDK